jgi:hypothetical protein
MCNIYKIVMIWTMAVISGCAHSPELIKYGSVNTRSNIFKVISNEKIISQGYAQLSINASVKKDKPGDNLFVNKSPDSFDRTLLVNIDGQALLVKGKIREEGNNDIDPQNPEAGVGIRYIFNSVMEIKTGAHHIIIAIPDSNIAIEKEITLLEGTVNYIQLKPIYRQTEIKEHGRGRGRFGVASFHEGIESFILKSNGTNI